MILHCRKLKKVFSCFLTAALVAAFSVPNIAVWGAVELNLTGDGTKNNPYLIEDADDLVALQQYVNEGGGSQVYQYYRQTADIDLSGIANWTPIGTEDHPFEGVFDGQNHVDTGLKIDRSQGECQGLFGYVSGTDDAHKAQIKNVAVRDAQIRARAEVGAVVGRYGQFTQGFVEPLENCAMIGGTI